MELHQLRYFCAVAESGSFSRAAEQSHVSQPSLSQQILKLEDELGARLFDRLGRAVRLTEGGEKVLPRGGGGVRGGVTVGEEITPVLLERLRASVVDVAILALPIRGHEFETFPLLKEDLFAALPKKHKFAGRAAISLKTLREDDFLLLRDGHC